MTRPPFDIENALREALRARVNGDDLMHAIARLADKLADGFRADFDTTMDMEMVGKALVVAGASLVPLADPMIPPAALINMVGLAGENLVRTARSRASEAQEVEGVVEEACRAVEVEGAEDADLAVVPLPEVARVFHEECGRERTRVKPQLDPRASQAARLAWKAAVVAFDTGLTLRLWSGAEFGNYLVGVEGGSSGPFGFDDAWTYLSGIASGATAVVRKQHWVLTWHPVAEGFDEPIEVPLNEHLSWAPDELGEFKLEAREVVSGAPEVSGG